jgi:ATP-binding cassette subfamily F protein uup
VPAKRDEKPKRTAKLNQAERRELDGLFERIEAIESHARTLQEKLADPATYQALGDGVAALREELEATEAEALRLTTRWEELEARSAG